MKQNEQIVFWFQVKMSTSCCYSPPASCVGSAAGFLSCVALDKESKTSMYNLYFGGAHCSLPMVRPSTVTPFNTLEGVFNKELMLCTDRGAPSKLEISILYLPLALLVVIFRPWWVPKNYKRYRFSRRNIVASRCCFSYYIMIPAIPHDLSSIGGLS